MKLDYLVTGTGRCGTVGMAKLLTSAGIPCGHESFFDSKGIHAALTRLNGEKRIKLSWVSTNAMEPDGSWHPTNEWVDIFAVTSESSYFAAPYLDHEALEGTKFIHIVRNPVKVVNSFVNSLNYFDLKDKNDPIEEFIYSVFPYLRGSWSQLERACLYYVWWNEMIKSKLKNKNFLFHRIEDGVQPVLDFIGKQKTKNLYTETDANTMRKRGEKSFQINQLPEGYAKNRFIEIGQQYGYEMSSDYLVV